MRANARKALTAWETGKRWRGAESIWSDGVSIWSYRTELVTRDAEGRVLLNVTRYSPTTSRHQNALAVAIPDAVQVDGVARGGYLLTDEQQVERLMTNLLA